MRGLFFVLMVILMVGCESKKQERKPSPKVSVLQVATTPLSKSTTIKGQIEASAVVPIYARTSGYILKRHFKEGDVVHKNQLLYTLDATDLEFAYSSAKASLAKAETTHLNTKQKADRARTLYEAKAMSPNEYDAILASESETKAALDYAKAEADKAKQNLAYTQIYSPIHGVSEATKIDTGTYVTGGGSVLLTTIYQTNPLYLSFFLDESSWSQWQHLKNKTVRLSLKLANNTSIIVSATLDYTAPAIDVTTGTIACRATLKPHKGLLPNQFVTLNLVDASPKEVMMLPQTAVMTGPKGRFVYLVKPDKTVAVKPVEIGDWVGDKVVIRKGLQLGDGVAIDGLGGLKAGMSVEIANPK